MTNARTQGKAKLHDLLLRDHARLDDLFERLLAGFHADARDELRTLWTELDSSLRAHLALEEKDILPEFAKIDPAEARYLAAEHERIRALLSELGIAVDLHAARESTIIDLVALLKAHARREDRLMYRWAATNIAPATQSKIVRELRRAFETVVGAR